MSLDVGFYSRFKNTESLIFDGVETFGVWNQPNFMANVDDRFVINFPVSSEFEGRPDLISLRFYGTTLLDWVVIGFNAPRDVFNWPRAGVTIRIPSRNVVMPGID